MIKKDRNLRRIEEPVWELWADMEEEQWQKNRTMGIDRGSDTFKIRKIMVSYNNNLKIQKL